METTFFIIAQTLTTLGLGAACVSLALNAHFTKWSKTIDITNTFLRRYDELMKERDLVFKERQSPEMYWRRYWHLQQEEYTMWKNGIVDKKFFDMWIDYRRKEWKGIDKLQGEEYRKNWEETKDCLDEDFRDFMDGKFLNQESQTTLNETTNAH